MTPSEIASYKSCSWGKPPRPHFCASCCQVFVDTAAWLALINIDDDFHDLAKQVRKKLQQDNCSLITSDFVLLEVADALTTPIRSQIINFINRLRSLSGLK